MSHKGPVVRVDWFQVLVDLGRGGFSVAEVSKQVDVPKATLMGWKNLGHEPRHVEGERLLLFWARALNRPLDQAPRTHAPHWLG